MTININKATVQDIEALGFQSQIAKYILDCRDFYKGFSSETDLQKMDLTADELKILLSNVTFNDTITTDESIGSQVINLLNSSGGSVNTSLIESENNQAGNKIKNETLLNDFSGVLLKIKEYYDEYKQIEEIVRLYEEMESAYKEWENDDQNFSLGVKWVHETGDLLFRVNGYVFQKLPEPIKTILTDLNTVAINTLYVLVNELEEYVKRIDKVSNSGLGKILYDDDNPELMSCSTIHMTPVKRNIIKGLDIEEHLKKEIFHETCASGLKSALKKYGVFSPFDEIKAQ